MTDKVVYKCKKCQEPFEVEQGSRRQYCEKCLAQRVLKGKATK
jgi:DNA-directed RNA polymerase subunit RPC12/RpoP